MVNRAFLEAHASTVPVMDVGKEGRTLIGPLGYLNRKLSC